LINFFNEVMRDLIAPPRKDSVKLAARSVSNRHLLQQSRQRKHHGFDSPQLHQPVAPDWQDDPGFKKTRQFRVLAGRGRVSHGDWTVSWPNEPSVLAKVSGRKIPFPGMQFAPVG
jgi:hypothetical protein